MNKMKDEIPTFDAVVRQLGIESGIAEWHEYMGGAMMHKGNDLRAQARVLQLMGYVGKLEEIGDEIWVHEKARFLALVKTGGRGVDIDGNRLSDPEVPTPAEAY